MDLWSFEIVDYVCVRMCMWYGKVTTTKKWTKEHTKFEIDQYNESKIKRLRNQNYSHHELKSHCKPSTPTISTRDLKAFINLTNAHAPHLAETVFGFAPKFRLETEGNKDITEKKIISPFALKGHTRITFSVKQDYTSTISLDEKNTRSQHQENL